MAYPRRSFGQSVKYGEGSVIICELTIYDGITYPFPIIRYTLSPTDAWYDAIDWLCYTDTSGNNIYSIKHIVSLSGLPESTLRVPLERSQPQMTHAYAFLKTVHDWLVAVAKIYLGRLADNVELSARWSPVCGGHGSSWHITRYIAYHSHNHVKYLLYHFEINATL